MAYSKSDPAGFTRYCREQEYRAGVEFLVPTHLKSALLEEDVRRKREREIQKAAQKRADAQDSDLSSDMAETDEFMSGGESSGAIAPPKSKAEKELEKEASVWNAIDTKDATLPHAKPEAINATAKAKGGKDRLRTAESKWAAKSAYAVFKSEQALGLYKSMERHSSDDLVRLKAVYGQLVQIGTTRRVLGAPDSLKPLQELATRQPQFKEVVQSVMDQMTMARRSRNPLRLQPMLLVGEAGVGKTHFAQCLARALATSIYVQPLDSELTSSFLLGSDRKWGNSQHGLLFEQLVLGTHANPVIVLDEIDKTQRLPGHSSPLASLHTLLEPVSAKAVRDISLLFEFDAGMVTWLATANQVTHLDAPLRSRFREFHIMPPDAQECLMLAGDVMGAAIEAVGIKRFSKDVGLRRHLAHLPARQIGQLTREAMGRAIANERMYLEASDFPTWLFGADADTPKTPTNRMH